MTISETIQYVAVKGLIALSLVSVGMLINALSTLH